MPPASKKKSLGSEGSGKKMVRIGLPKDHVDVSWSNFGGKWSDLFPGFFLTASVPAKRFSHFSVGCLLGLEIVVALYFEE